MLCHSNAQARTALQATAQGQTMMGVGGQNFGVGHLCAI